MFQLCRSFFTWLYLYGSDPSMAWWVNQFGRIDYLRKPSASEGKTCRFHSFLPYSKHTFKRRRILPISISFPTSLSRIRSCRKMRFVGSYFLLYSINLNYFFLSYSPAFDDGEQAVDFLKSNELETEVNQLCDKARAMGITGVPVIIIDGKWAIKGGHSSEVFVQVRYLFCEKRFFQKGWLPIQIFKKLAICTGVSNSSVSNNGNGSDSFAVIDTLTAWRVVLLQLIFRDPMSWSWRFSISSL